MRALAKTEIPFTEEDVEADVFGVDNYGCMIYRAVTDRISD